MPIKLFATTLFSDGREVVSGRYHHRCHPWSVATRSLFTLIELSPLIRLTNLRSERGTHQSCLISWYRTNVPPCCSPRRRRCPSSPESESAASQWVTDATTRSAAPKCRWVSHLKTLQIDAPTNRQVEGCIGYLTDVQTYVHIRTYRRYVHTHTYICMHMYVDMSWQTEISNSLFCYSSLYIAM